MKKKYSIDDLDLNCDYRDAGLFRSYHLTARGDTWEEFIADATIYEVDQDGETLGYYDVNEADVEPFNAAWRALNQEFNRVSDLEINLPAPKMITVEVKQPGADHYAKLESFKGAIEAEINFYNTKTKMKYLFNEKDDWSTGFGFKVDSTLSGRIQSQEPNQANGPKEEHKFQVGDRVQGNPKHWANPWTGTVIKIEGDKIICDDTHETVHHYMGIDEAHQVINLIKEKAPHVHPYEEYLKKTMAEDQKIVDDAMRGKFPPSTAVNYVPRMSGQKIIDTMRKAMVDIPNDPSWQPIAVNAQGELITKDYTMLKNALTDAFALADPGVVARVLKKYPGLVELLKGKK